MSKNLGDLDVDEIALWIKSISLSNVFLPAFKEQQIDGSMLKECEEDDFEPSDYPNARKMHWKKFWSVRKNPDPSSNIFTLSCHHLVVIN